MTRLDPYLSPPESPPEDGPPETTRCADCLDEFEPEGSETKCEDCAAACEECGDVECSCDAH